MENEEVQLTPKGFFCCLIENAMDRSNCDRPANEQDYASEQWDIFEAFCIKRLHQIDPDARFAALIFDGGGGEVIGATTADDV